MPRGATPAGLASAQHAREPKSPSPSAAVVCESKCRDDSGAHADVEARPPCAIDPAEPRPLQNPSNVKLGREPSYPLGAPAADAARRRARAASCATHGRKLWWLHSAYALALGTGVVAFAQQGFDHARWLAVSLGPRVAARRAPLPALRAGRAGSARSTTSDAEDAGALLRDDVRAQEPLPGDALLSPALLLEVDDARRGQRLVRHRARGLRDRVDARHRLRSRPDALAVDGVDVPRASRSSAA